MKLIGFADIKELMDEFKIEDLDGMEILFAQYEMDSFDCGGQCVVLCKKEDGLFIVDASHCSCYALEGQFDPVEISEGVLKMQFSHAPGCLRDQEFFSFCTKYFGWNK